MPFLPEGQRPDTWAGLPSSGPIVSQGSFPAPTWPCAGKPRSWHGSWRTAGFTADLTDSASSANLLHLTHPPCMPLGVVFQAGVGDTIQHLLGPIWQRYNGLDDDREARRFSAEMPGQALTFKLFQPLIKQTGPQG